MAASALDPSGAPASRLLGPFPQDGPQLADWIEARCRQAEHELVLSLQQLAGGEAAAGQSPARAAGLRQVATLMAEALRQRPPGALDPIVWLMYYRLGQAILADGGCAFSWPGDAGRILQRIERRIPPGSVIAWGDAGIQPPQEWDEILALLQEGGDFPADLLPPEPAVYRSIRNAIGEVRALIANLNPSLGLHLDHLLPLTILARPGTRARLSGHGFGGATTFFLRGASVIHAAASLTLPGLLERLVHEAAHAELFVIGQDTLLCHNPEDERHPVQIRADPRPMNGILHSLYVTGRVCQTLDAVLADGLPWHSDRQPLLDECRQLRHQQTALGLSSLDAVRRHGRLTPLGEAVCEASAQRLNAPPGAA